MLFGAISLYRIPVQMTPTVDRPVITVETEYKGAAPLEVEEEVSKPIEEKLTSVEGLDRMTSRSEEGKSRVVLEFDWDVNKDVARLDVSEKLGLVRNLPDDSDRSTISALNSDSENPIAWVIVETKLPINEVRVEDAVNPAKLRSRGRAWGRCGCSAARTGGCVTSRLRGHERSRIIVSRLRRRCGAKNKQHQGGRSRRGQAPLRGANCGQHSRASIIAQIPRRAKRARRGLSARVAKVSFDYGDPTRTSASAACPPWGSGFCGKPAPTPSR